jgi:hypothetical protein
MKINGFEVETSNKRGGKAGRGCNRTATVQVRQPINGDAYLLLKQFRYNTNDNTSFLAALAKAEEC